MTIFNYHTGKVSVPRQLVIKRDASSIPELVNRAGLTLPLGMHMLFSQVVFKGAYYTII